MQYNGVDPDTIHRAVKRGREYPPELVRDIRTIETTTGVLVAYTKGENSPYRADINIAAKSLMEAEEAMEAVRAWAMGGGGVHELAPTYCPGLVYDAIFEGVTPPTKWEGNGFGVCQVRWMLTNPHKRSSVQSRTNTTGTSLSLWVPGTEPTDMEIEVTPQAAASTLTLKLDGETFFVRNASTAAGKTIKIVMERGEVTLDGAAAEAETDWMQTDYDRQLTHGRHTLTCSQAARIAVRWYDRWV